VSRILVIRGGALGDFLLTLPAIRLLREGFPSASIEILGYEHIVRLAEMSGYAEAVRSIEYGPLSSFFRRDGSLPPELIDYFSGFDQVISYLFDPDQIFARNLRRAGVRHLITGSPKMNDQEHAARQLARPLESLALYLQDPVARIQPNEKRKLDPELMAIHCSSGSESKNWPLDRFLSLSNALLQQSEKRRLLFVVGEADHARWRELQPFLPPDKIQLVDNLPLTALANLLQNCAGFVGHDSGISHLAAAVGVPSVLLFGPTDPAIWAPQNGQVRVLRGPNRTMEEIGVREVLDSLGELTN
jgi:heptosyltransferase III